MYVIAMIHKTPTSSTQPPEALAPIELFGPWNRKNQYCPATWARLPMTRMSAATVAQPPAQPIAGPNALVDQMNVAPQSGSALLSSLKPSEHRSIGKNASPATRGDFS